MVQSRFLIVGVLAMLISGELPGSLFGQLETSKEGAQEEAEQAQQTKTVSLFVNFGDGFEKRYTQLAWSEDLTVADAMDAAMNHRRALEYRSRGEGETAFLMSIDGEENEGGSGSNWIYYVNGERADRGFGAKVLQSGDTVLWRFEK